MYKLGKTPARPGAVAFKLSTYLKTTLPTPPSSVSGSKYYPKAWGMLGNDSYGDCVWAGAGHETMFWNNEAKVSIPFTDKASLSDYTAVTGFNPNDPNSDQGTDMETAAKYRRKTGVVDANGKRHVVAAYLDVTKGNVDQLKQAIYLFGAVGIGIEFPESAMTQFNNGKPWSVVKGAQIDGGHYIPAIGYNKTYIYIVTWGKVQKMTWAFFKKYCDEAIVYLSQEMLTNGVAQNKLNLAQLQADINSL